MALKLRPTDLGADAVARARRYISIPASPLSDSRPYNFAVAHADLPNDLVYNIVRVVFEKHEEMMEVHAAAAATVPANVERNTFLPLHPGAIRYYRQIGYGGGP
jgi:hypothetical protein